MGAILRVAPPERVPRYIIPHPAIYLVLELEANRLKNDRVIEWAPFGECVPATFHHDVPSQDPALDQIGAKSVKKRQSYCIFSVFGGGAGSGAAAPLPVWRAASSLHFEVVTPWGVTTQKFKPLP